MNPVRLREEMVSVPKYTEKQSMAIAMESTCPMDRMVATMPDAMPRYSFLTELMIALVFGEEKRAYPNPSRKQKIKNPVG